MLNSCCAEDSFWLFYRGGEVDAKLWVMSAGACAPILSGKASAGCVTAMEQFHFLPHGEHQVQLFSSLHVEEKGSRLFWKSVSFLYQESKAIMSSS